MSKTERICVLGNSHLAAAKRGWVPVADQYPHHKLTFFGAPWDMMGQLEVEEGALIATTPKLAGKLKRSSDGLDRIEACDFDHFVLYGLQYGPRRIVLTYRNFRPVSFEWRAPLHDLAPFRRSFDPVQAISEKLFDRIAVAGLKSSLAMRIAGQLQQITDAPISLVTAPGFSENALECGDWDGPLGAGDLERLAKRTPRLLRKACLPGINIVQPKPHLTRLGLFTAATYAAPPRDGGQPDHVHTSSEYAREMLAAALGSDQLVERPAA